MGSDRRWGPGVRLLSLLLVFLVSATFIPLGAAARVETVTRDFSLPLPLFAAGSAWNQRVDDAPVLAESDAQVLVTYRVLRQDTSFLADGVRAVNDYPYIYVNCEEFSAPIGRAGGTNRSVVVRDYAGALRWNTPKLPAGTPGGPIVVPAPAGPVRPAGPQTTAADGHLVLYGRESGVSWDYWDATTVMDPSGGSLGGGRVGPAVVEAGAVDWFDVNGPGANIEPLSSARATGTPLLAGLLVPEDVERGEIRHALAFAIPGPRNTATDPESIESGVDYFYPASTSEVIAFSRNPAALAAGQRLRLRDRLVDLDGMPIDERSLAPITRLFLRALREYGAYCVDNAGGLAMYAEDPHTARLDLDDGAVNALAGRPSGTPFAPGEPRWQVVMATLNDELGTIPFATGPWPDGSDPASAIVTAANFEVVAPAMPPVADRLPPSAVSGLAGATNTSSEIAWSWTDPPDPDFATVALHLDGVLVARVEKGVQRYRSTGLEPGASHTLAARTVDLAGNLNGSWVNLTVGMAPPVIPFMPGMPVPLDLDGDGKYEDVNGNGRKDFADVVLYFDRMTWIESNEPLAAFDYNGNGRIDFADVTWLFLRL
jgi:PKD repeat protein